MRIGLLAEKLGMTRIFTPDGEHVPVTVLRVDECEVTANRTAEKDGYNAVQLGSGKAKTKRVSNAMRGHYAKAKVAPKKNSPSSGSTKMGWWSPAPSSRSIIRGRPVCRCFRHVDR